MATETKTEQPKVKRVNMNVLFDLIDDIWVYVERNESRSRHFGKLHGTHKEEFDDIRQRIADIRTLVHPKPATEDEEDGQSTGDSTDQ